MKYLVTLNMQGKRRLTNSWTSKEKIIAMTINLKPKEVDVISINYELHKVKALVEVEQTVFGSTSRSRYLVNQPEQLSQPTW